jgi:hypothetical protein
MNLGGIPPNYLVEFCSIDVIKASDFLDSKLIHQLLNYQFKD